jgi:hypothetical protein
MHMPKWLFCTTFEDGLHFVSQEFNVLLMDTKTVDCIRKSLHMSAFSWKASTSVDIYHGHLMRGGKEQGTYLLHQTLNSPLCGRM